MNGLFDEKQSKTTPAMSRRLKQHDAFVKSEQRLEEEQDLKNARDHFNEEKNKRIQSALTTVAIHQGDTAEEAIEIPTKMMKNKKKSKQEKKNAKK